MGNRFFIIQRFIVFFTLFYIKKGRWCIFPLRLFSIRGFAVLKTLSSAQCSCFKPIRFDRRLKIRREAGCFGLISCWRSADAPRSVKHIPSASDQRFTKQIRNSGHHIVGVVGNGWSIAKRILSGRNQRCILILFFGGFAVCRRDAVCADCLGREKRAAQRRKFNAHRTLTHADGKY